MSTEENQALLQRLYDEVLGSGKLEVADEILAPGFVDHDPDNPQGDRAGVKQFVAMVHSGFPDLALELGDLIASGDRVVARFTITGTHRGAFMGIPPTGRQVAISCIDIVRCEQGKIAEHWGQADTLGLLQQLGVVPAPTPA